MKIYISGPITGYVPEERRETFQRAASRLAQAGYHPIDPMNETPEQPNWAAYMRADIALLLQCDAVALLPGWDESRGSRIEAQLAIDLGIPTKTLERWL